MKKLINLFISLCHIDSPTGEEEKIANYILDYFKKIKIFAKKR